MFLFSSFTLAQLIWNSEVTLEALKGLGKLLYPKIQQTKMLLTCQRICFYLGWSGGNLQFRQNIINVDSKSWLPTSSNNITLSLPSYTDSALKIVLNFCNGYLSLLYFWLPYSRALNRNTYAIFLIVTGDIIFKGQNCVLIENAVLRITHNLHGL